MKHIKLIETLSKRAQAKGHATHRRRDIYDGMHYTDKDGFITVYAINYFKNDNIVELYHYNTLTCKIDLNNNKVIDIYCESRSDIDSVYTFIYYWLNKHVTIGYKPVNGGFYVQTNKLDYNNKTKQFEKEFINYYYDIVPFEVFLDGVNDLL